MRVLRIHAPGTDAAVADAITGAVRAFNAALDIRLRFLAIGIEETLAARGAPVGRADTVADALGEAAYDAVVLLGDAEAALVCAGAVERAGVPLVRVGAGARAGREAGAARALDRLARTAVALDEAAAAALGAEGIPCVGPGAGEAQGPGELVVEALMRIRRQG